MLRMQAALLLDKYQHGAHSCNGSQYNDAGKKSEDDIEDEETDYTTTYSTGGPIDVPTLKPHEHQRTEKRQRRETFRGLARGRLAAGGTDGERTRRKHTRTNDGGQRDLRFRSGRSDFPMKILNDKNSFLPERGQDNKKNTNFEAKLVSN